MDDIIMSHDAVIFDDGFHVPGMVKSMVVIEAAVDGSVWDSRADRRGLVFFGGIGLPGIRIEVLEIEMPFSYDGRVVALVAKKIGNSGSIFRYETGSEAGHHALLERRTPGITPRHDPVAGGRAYRRARMRIGKCHSFSGELVGTGGRYLRSFRSKTMDVAIPEIIAQDENDIRFLGSPSRVEEES